MSEDATTTGKILRDYPASGLEGGRRAPFRQEDNELFPRLSGESPAPAESGYSATNNLRARNLNLLIHVLDGSSGALITTSLDYYLCFREGLYVGKFLESNLGTTPLPDCPTATLDTAHASFLDELT